MELFIFIMIVVLMIISNVFVKSTYKKYSKIMNNNKNSGFEIARSILDANGLDYVHVVETPGYLSDHYDPRRRVVRLSPEVFDGTSISSIAIASHECGHAIQDKEGYIYLKIRSLLFPIVSIADRLTYILFFLGIILEIIDLVYIALALMILGLLFQIITLPVEFNASKRAKEQIDKLKLANPKEISSVNSVLTSAAFTYIAGTLITALNMIRILVSSRDNR